MRSQIISCKLVVGRKRTREYKICKSAEIINWYFNSLDVTDNVTFLQTNIENEVEI